MSIEAVTVVVFRDWWQATAPRDDRPVPIDYYAVCATHYLRGPGVWRCVDPDELRAFLIDHASCDVRIYDEFEAIDSGRYDDWPGPGADDGA